MTDTQAQTGKPPHLLLLEEIGGIEKERDQSNASFDSRIFERLEKLRRIGLTSTEPSLVSKLVLDLLALALVSKSADMSNRTKKVSKELQRHLKQVRLIARRMEQSQALTVGLREQRYSLLQTLADLASLAAFLETSVYAKRTVLAILAAEGFEALASHEGLNWLIVNYSQEKE